MAGAAGPQNRGAQGPAQISLAHCEGGGGRCGLTPNAKLAEIGGQSLAADAAQAPKVQAMSQHHDASSCNPCPTARADGLGHDAGAYLDQPRLYEPASYGTTASMLNSGATRAWSIVPVQGLQKIIILQK
jgi:hypothetical protein